MRCRPLPCFAVCQMASINAMQAIATLGAVPHLLRLLESSNEVIAEGASETMLHIATPSEGNGNSHPSQSAVRAAGGIPSLLGVVCTPHLPSLPFTLMSSTPA